METCTSQKPRVQRGELALLAPEMVAALVGVIKALSDPIRVQMVHLLEQRPDLCTCEFEALLDLGQSKVSYHLKILLDAGLVTRETYGTWSHYRLAQPAVVVQLERLAGAEVAQLVAAD